jgi:hypothetical protein
MGAIDAISPEWHLPAAARQVGTVHGIKRQQFRNRDAAQLRLIPEEAQPAQIVFVGTG